MPKKKHLYRSRILVLFTKPASIEVGFVVYAQMFVNKSNYIYTCSMRKIGIISTALLFIIIFNACKRGPGTCGDGKENGGETSLDCGASCKLCPPPIAPNGNYIIGRIADAFFTEQADPNLSVASFKVGNDKYEMYSTAGFYSTNKINGKPVSRPDLVIGIAQTFKYDTAKVPTVQDFIDRIDSGYQNLGALSFKNEVLKDGFFIQYKNKAIIKDTLVIYSNYNNATNQPGSYIKVKRVKRISDDVYNITGEYQCAVYHEDLSIRFYIDKGRFNLNFKIK